MKAPSKFLENLQSKAFSLVEVVLALGICSFAMIAIVGMIPVGLSTFRDAMDTSVQSQIVQGLASEILLTDYWNIQEKPYYYDDQGSPLQDSEAAMAPNLAYTAVVQTGAVLMPVEPQATITDDSAKTILIRVARTRPGQTFSQIETDFPNQIHSYPVIVGNMHSLNNKPATH